MSAFKKLQLGDSTTLGYTSKKKWSIPNTELSTYGIQVSSGITGSDSLFLGDPNYESILKYKSINHLYYTNKADGSIYHTGSYDNYEQSSLYFEDSRILSSSISVISIPKDIIGLHIEPKSFKTYINSGSGVYLITDDGEGRLLFEHPSHQVADLVYFENGIDIAPNHTQQVYTSSLLQEGLVCPASQGNNGTLYGFYYENYIEKSLGDIIYTHGILSINNHTSSSLSSSLKSCDFNWTSNYDVYTTSYNIKVKNSEFNFTQNPSSYNVTGSLISSNLTGSEFTPYVTSIGLYNDVNELIAVAKLSRPIPKSKDTDMTFVINLDM